MAAQTITTVVNFDSASVSGLANAETITITGGDLTIDSDIRHCQNAAVLGAVSGTTSTKNKLTITSENTWEIPFGGFNKVYSCSSLLLGFDGSIVDESPNPKTLTVSGSPTIVTASSLTVSENRLSFNTINDGIEIAHAGTDFDLGTGDFIFHAEFQCDTIGPDRNIAKFCSLANGYAALRITIENGQVRVRVSSNGTSWAINRLAPNAFTANNPTVLNLTRKGNTWNLYLNSVLADTWTSSASLMNNDVNCVHRIGSNSDGSSPFVGFMDEVILVKGAAALYTTPLGFRNYKWDRTTWTSGCSSGLVPVLNALGSNTVTGLTSGATGELLRVFTRDMYLDLPELAVAGAAMPDFGFIKLRTKTGTFIEGETISLPGGATIIAKDAGKASWINVPGRETSVLSLTKSTDFKAVGKWHLLGYTSGKANQVVMFPVADYCPGLYIETGPGTNQYIWWLNGGSRWQSIPQTVSTDSRGTYFGNNINTGALRLARRSITDNCGYLPPAGCRIYVGGVILSNCASTTNNYGTNLMSIASTTQRYQVASSNNGVVKLDKVSCNWSMVLNNAYSVDIRATSIPVTLNIFNPTTKPYLGDVAVGLLGTLDSTAIILSNCVKGVDLMRPYVVRYKSDVANTSAGQLLDCSGTSTVSEGYFHFFGGPSDSLRGSSSAFALLLQRSYNVTLQSVKTAGGRIYTNSCVNGRIYDTRYADQVMGETPTTNAINAIEISAFSKDFIVEGFSNYDGLPNVHPYTSAFAATSNTVNVEFRGLGTPSNPYNAGTANKMGYIFAGNVSENTRLKRCYATNLRLAPIATATSMNGFYCWDVWGDPTLTQALVSSDTETRNCKWTRTGSGQSAVYGRHFEDYMMSDTAKYLSVAFNQPTARTIDQVQLYGYEQEFCYPRLSRFLKTGSVVISEDKLSCSGQGMVLANTSVTADSLVKWCWEVTPTSIVDMATIGVGRSTSTTPGQDAGCVAYLSTGEILLAGTIVTYGASYGINDVIGVAIDMSLDNLTFYKNGISQGIAITGMTGIYYPAVGSGSYTADYSVNFGQLARAYPVPDTYTKDYGNPSAFFTATGSLAMPNLSDEVIMETNYFVMGTVSMANVAPIFTGTNPSNFYVDFQYDKGTGYNGTWVQCTAANFVAVGAIDPLIGIRIKLRVAVMTSAATNQATYYLLPFVTNTVAQAYTVPEPITLIDAVVSNLIPGSRVRIYNLSTSTELYNNIVNSSALTLSYENGQDTHTGDTLEIRVTRFSSSTCSLPFITNAIASDTGWSVFVSQTNDSIYEQIGYDGSSISEFSMDTVNNYIKINKGSKETTVQLLYAWSAYYRDTQNGISTMFNTLEAIDFLNYRRNPSSYAWYLYNELLTSVRVSGAYLYSSDDSFFIADSVAGVSGSIFLDAKRAYSVETGVSGLTMEESTVLTSIAAQVSTKASQASLDTAVKQIKNVVLASS